ncbi:MAG: universal stress protein [Pseudomonadales bacterium]
MRHDTGSRPARGRDQQPKTKGERHVRHSGDLAYLNKRPGTLAVMGRRGLSPIKSLLLGSVSDKVVRHATNPVLVVN